MRRSNFFFARKFSAWKEHGCVQQPWSIVSWIVFGISESWRFSRIHSLIVYLWCRIGNRRRNQKYQMKFSLLNNNYWWFKYFDKYHSESDSGLSFLSSLQLVLTNNVPILSVCIYFKIRCYTITLAVYTIFQ